MNLEQQNGSQGREEADSEFRIQETMPTQLPDASRPASRNAGKKRRTNLSLRKVKANRRNASRSTGPRTAKGKNVARWNALRHGMLAREVVLPPSLGSEDPGEFYFLLEQLRDDLSPSGALEEILVEKVAACYWRLRRLFHSEAGEVLKSFGSIGPAMVREVLYRKLAGMGETLTEEERNDFIQAETARRHLPAGEVSDTLLRYEMTLERGFYRALHLLERTQRRRNGEAVPPPVSVEFSATQ